MQVEFNNHIKTALPFLIKSKLLIAVSGGMDSVVLVHLCHQSDLNISLAHCNFNLRGEESDADEAFVLQIAKDLELDVYIENFDTEAFSKEQSLSTQMAARELRYEWFFNLAEQLKFDYILTAHHADDNLETFLINFTRGSGLDGLVGIPEMNDNVVRPLLEFSREDLESYAIEEKIEWREDSSNATNKYLRNQLRHDIIPTLKQMNPQLLRNFQKTLSHLHESQEIVKDAISKIRGKVVSVEDDIIKFNIKELNELSNPKGYLYNLLKEYHFTEWEDVTNLLSAQSGKQVYSATHRLLKDRDFLLLKEIQPENFSKITINIEALYEQSLHGNLSFDEVENITEKDECIIYVDKYKLQFPLELRTWKEADYFYPFGMKGKKKLSKYFKDEKLSLIDKEQIHLLCSGEDIVWIIGKRADDRFKVTDETKQILKITHNSLC